MSVKDPGIDLYISKSADFAKPILNHFRKLIHKTCPEVEETIKWGFPHYVYKEEILCSMAAFKHHCAFGFWKASLMKDKILTKNAASGSAMGHYGRITTLNDLPPDKKIIAHIKKAMLLNEKGVKLPKKNITKEKNEMVVPDYFLNQLKKNKKAFNTFINFSPSHKREYIEWITQAKTEKTKNRRIETSIEWLAAEKPLNWKYIRK